MTKIKAIGDVQGFIFSFHLLLDSEFQETQNAVEEENNTLTHVCVNIEMQISHNRWLFHPPEIYHIPTDIIKKVN